VDAVSQQRAAVDTHTRASSDFSLGLETRDAEAQRRLFVLIFIRNEGCWAGVGMSLDVPARDIEQRLGAGKLPGKLGGEQDARAYFGGSRCSHSLCGGLRGGFWLRDASKVDQDSSFLFCCTLDVLISSDNIRNQQVLSRARVEV
jgi:hypothetical protein